MGLFSRPTFEALFRENLPRLYRLAFRFTHSRADAEDLVQELCKRLLPDVEKVRKLDRPGPWLARALHNLYVDGVRQRARSPIDSVEVLPEIESAAPGPDERVALNITLENIEAALEQLPADQRAVLAWHDIEGYTLEELADTRDLPLGTVKSRLHRARINLRRLLREPFPGPGRVRE
jgi:RNA polymerase sigma factor (sigma-70 family)